jgi:hypothetical protein
MISRDQRRRRWGMRDDSLKTEEKTTAGVRVNERDRIPAIVDRCVDSPPVHQQVCLVPDGTNVHLR